MTIAATSLKYYYSGGSANSDPALSIGGAMSSVQHASSPLNSLFDDVTGDEAEAGLVEYRLLYFVQEAADATGLIDPIFWLTADAPSDASMAIGIADAGKNAVETAPANDHTAPSGVSFSSPLTKGAGLALPDAPYEEDDYVGLWFRRTVPAASDIYPADGCAWAVEGDTV